MENKNVVKGILKNRVIYLSEQNLITAAERDVILPIFPGLVMISQGEREMEAEVFRLLMKKEMSKSFTIFKILKLSELSNEYEDSSMTASLVGRNPLEIAEILDCVLGFLPVDDIKKCCLVSKKWNRVSELLLRKLPRIWFDSSLGSTADRSISNFTETFENCGTQKPFSAVGIKKMKDKTAYWTETSLRELFEKLPPTFNDLKIIDIKFKGRTNRIVDFQNILNTSHLTALNVSLRGSHEFSFSLDKIINVKYLRLSQCLLYLTNGIRISPIVIDLQDCRFQFPDENSSGHVINQFINFMNVRLCTIHHGVNRRRRQLSGGNDISLDFAGSAEVDTVNLLGVTVYNWGISNWKINTIVLEGIHGRLGSSLIVVNDLEFRHCGIPLLDIPETVEVLSLVNTSLENDGLHSHTLPNLKTLKLYQPSLNMLNFIRIIRGEHLVALELDSSFSSANLELTTFPSGLKKLKITATATEIRCHGRLCAQLETIVLNNLSIQSILDIMPKVQTQNIVLRLSTDTQRDFKNNVEALKYLSKPYKSIAIGPFKWAHFIQMKISNKTSSRLEQMVNEKFEYYIFRDKKASYMEKSEFEYLVGL